MAVTISVIIPVYNCERYLKRCLDSVCAQTFNDFEVILVNDGSKDRSEKICQEYTHLDERFHLVSQTNQGQAAARNVGIRQSSGEWVHFIDADDAIHPQMLEILYSEVLRTGAGMSMCGFVEGNRIPDSFLNRVERIVQQQSYDSSEEDLYRLLMQGDKKYWVVWGKLIRKSIVEKQLFEVGRIYEDNAVICKWFVHAGSVVDVQKELYFYFSNSEGTTKSAFSEKQLDRLWALNQQAEFYESIGYNRLRDIMETRYIVACASCYRLAESKKLKRSIKKLYYRKQLINGKKIHLTSKEKIHVLEAFYPVCMQIYWIIRGKVFTILRRTQS